MTRQQFMHLWDRHPIHDWILCGMFTLVAWFNLHQSMQENIAHDALPYMASYTGKFASEGRWINFLLFDGLRQVPAVVAGIICNLCLFIFGYNIAKKQTDNVLQAVLFGLLIVNIPYFTMLFKWPMTLIPGMVLLALISSLPVERYRYVTLLLSGIFLFATYPAFYFLLPLLFIHQLNDENYRSILRFVVVWMMGYVIGYAFAQAMVYLYHYFATGTGHFIEFATWRKSTPTTDMASLFANINKSYGNFTRNALYLSELSGWFFVPVIITGLWAIRYQTKVFLMTLLVIISIYASVIALGVKVPLRSGITLPFGLAMIALVNPSKFWRYCLLVSLFVPCAYQMYQYNHGYNHNRELIASMMEQHDGNHDLWRPHHYDRIYIQVDQDKVSQYFYQRTHSRSFTNLSNLRYHYIQPYLYQYGWKEKDIIVTDVSRENVKGQAFVKEKGNNLYVDIY